MSSATVRQIIPSGPATAFERMDVSLLRQAWTISMSLAVGLFVLAVPERLGRLQATARLLRDQAMVGPALVDLYPFAVLGLEITFVVSFLLVSAGIAWGHSHDWRALFFSAVFLTYAVWVTPTLDALPASGPWQFLVSIVQAVGLLFAIHFFLLFPDGRFVPSGCSMPSRPNFDTRPTWRWSLAS